MKSYLLWLTILLCCSLTAQHPFKKALKEQSGDSLIMEVNRIFEEDVISVYDSTNTMLLLDSLQLTAIKKNNAALLVTAMGLKGIYLKSILNDFEQALNAFNKAAAMAQQKNLKYLYAVFLHYQGFAEIRLGNYEEGFKKTLESDNILSDKGYRHIYKPERILYDIARVYHEFGNYGQAEAYLMKSLKFSDEEHIKIRVYNGLGIIYTDWEKHEKAIESFKKLLALVDKKKDTVITIITYSNIGMAYLSLSEDEMARTYLDKAYQLKLSQKHKSYGYSALLSLAKMELKENNLELAQTRTQEAVTIMRNYNIPTLEAWQSYYGTQASILKAKGNYKLALTFMDSSSLFKDSILKLRNSANLTNIQTQLTAERYLNNIRLLEQEKNTQTMLRNIILGVAFVIIVVILWLWNKTRLINKRKQQLLLDEKQQAVQRLHDFSRDMKAKNKLIEKLKQPSEEQTSTLNKRDNAPNEVIQTLQQSIILTDEDWSNFKKLLDLAYPQFLNNVRITYPDLTTSEVRLMALIKLNLNINEMANMLGILPQSVRKTRQRLLKKLQIENANQLPQLLSSI